jgi:hypothetical protein
MPLPTGQSWKSSREMKHLGMCLNCPIPWEMASLGDDWSPTWVEGIVDKLPPERVIRGRPNFFRLIGVSVRSMSVVGVMMYIYTP